VDENDIPFNKKAHHFSKTTLTRIHLAESMRRHHHHRSRQSQQHPLALTLALALTNRKSIMCSTLNIK